MQFIHVSEQDALTPDPDDSSSISLMRRGLRCFEQERYADGAVLFKLARERLSPDQIQLAVALDALNKAIANCVSIQKTLLEISKLYVEADTEQRMRVDGLKKLLPAVPDGSPASPSEKTTLRETPGENPRLRIVPPPIVIGEHCANPQTSPVKVEDRGTLPALFVSCFGRFEVRRFDPCSPPVELCNNLKGQTLFRYLITRPKFRETVEMLMTELWQEESPETAQHKLRVAASALRCSLNKGIINEPRGGYLLCKEQGYLLNPAVAIRTDVDEFLALYQAGREASGGTATMLYEKACRIYTGPFLVEDLYADWSLIRREELGKVYVVMCDRLAEFYLEAGSYEVAEKWASAILRVDRCDEQAHRQLIRIYVAQGRRSEALHQYQKCQRVLAAELGVQPMQETQKLLHMLS